ncbi:DsbE family thiol:disulfide interchange protein [Gilvimarinus polysaccharolyticus]|uniref:DsbE family thiol:disulfide interchange protein n=1 Tax=Gilvimarinus polysaccharolyticus TaxID=863921 RepID=UPI0006732C41|nr:DsbE family thiol:disulfide interchange protein [Gilvimarinus polysaccharolyticus]
MGRLKLFVPLIALLILLPLFYVGLSLDPNSMPSALVGNPVPEFELPMLEDDTKIIRSDDLKGEVALLNIWATWCFACKAEHPYLVRLAKQEGVKIIGINYRDERAPAQKWLKELHNPYQYSLFDKEGRLGLDLGVTGAPETYVIDRQGIVRYRHIGVVDERVWQETLKPLYQSLSAN